MSCDFKCSDSSTIVLSTTMLQTAQLRVRKVIEGFGKGPKEMLKELGYRKAMWIHFKHETSVAHFSELMPSSF